MGEGVEINLGDDADMRMDLATDGTGRVIVTVTTPFCFLRFTMTGEQLDQLRQAICRGVQPEDDPSADPVGAVRIDDNGRCWVFATTAWTTPWMLLAEPGEQPQWRTHKQMRGTRRGPREGESWTG